LIHPLRAAQAHPTQFRSRSNPALEECKSLAGEWEGKDTGGNAVSVSYQVLASGVVMERPQPGNYDSTVERVYGLNKPEELHMVELLMTFTDKDHVTQVWTNLTHGERSTNTITFARKK
jgi:hypothetical protein